jgi:hypothetical protein
MPLQTLKQKRLRLWKEHLFDTRGSESESRQAQRLALMETWSNDPWAYATGRDLPDLEREPAWPNGRPIWWTVDERDQENPVKPYPFIVEPQNYKYLEHLTRELWGPYRIVLIDKARQIYATTHACIMIDWLCTFHDEREVFFSRVKEESAIKLINDRIRTPQTRKPRWFRDLVGMSEAPQRIITWGNTGSTVTGVPQNFAVADARGPTASLTVVDEAAYQDYFPDIYKAVVPMTSRLWGITTANIGNPGAELYKKLIMEGRPGHEGDAGAPLLGGSDEAQVPLGPEDVGADGGAGMGSR